jgi:predicted glutamine amidotransferase
MIVGAGNISVDELVDGLQRMAEKGKHLDGWGIAWQEGNEFRVYKSPESCLDDPHVAEYRRIASPLVVLHARRSRFEKSHDNTHPWMRIVEGVPYVLCYNGMFQMDGAMELPGIFVENVFSKLVPGKEEESVAGVVDSLRRIFGANVVLARPGLAQITVRYNQRMHKHYQMTLSNGPDWTIVSSEPVREPWSPVSDHSLLAVKSDGEIKAYRAAVNSTF